MYEINIGIGQNCVVVQIQSLDTKLLAAFLQFGFVTSAERQNIGVR